MFVMTVVLIPFLKIFVFLLLFSYLEYPFAPLVMRSTRLLTSPTRARGECLTYHVVSFLPGDFNGSVFAQQLLSYRRFLMHFQEVILHGKILYNYCCAKLTYWGVTLLFPPNYNNVLSQICSLVQWRRTFLSSLRNYNK